VFLEAGQSKVISIDLSVEDFGLYDEEGKRHVRKGLYEVSFGGVQSDELSERLTGKQVYKKLIQVHQDYLDV
jgi:beta-glucosidase